LDITKLISTDTAGLYDVYIRASDKLPSYNALDPTQQEAADKKIKAVVSSHAVKRYNQYDCESCL